MIGLTQFLFQSNHEAVVTTEHEWQETLIRTSPVLKYSRVDLEENLKPDLENEELTVPDVYRSVNSYPSGWERLDKRRARCLSWPTDPEARFDVVIMFKSAKYRHRNESANMDAHRFVSERKYEKIMYTLAQKGYSVARIGGPEQRDLRQHCNIFDFKGCDPTMTKDLDLIASCEVAVFSDSGLWPISVALGKRTIVADVVSDQGSFIGSKFLSNVSWRLNTKAKNVFGWALDERLVILRKSLYQVGKISIFIPCSRRKLLKEITNQLG